MTYLKEKFKLTAAEANSALWMRLMEYFDDRINMLRAANDHPMTADETASVRGQIREIKALKAMETEYEMSRKELES